MKLETINGIRVITSNGGMWLCNEEQQVISDKVYLGVNANENDWRDITDKEKTRLEALWNNETPTDGWDEVDEEITDSEALKIITGGESL